MEKGKQVQFAREGLMVVRHGPKTGIWPWRRALYTVYRENADGSHVEILTEEFRGYKQAMHAALKLLRERHEV